MVWYLQFAEAVIRQLQELTTATPSSPRSGSAAEDGSSAAALQLALWLRLALLSPLLPLVYASKEGDPARNLRSILAPILLRCQQKLS